MKKLVLGLCGALAFGLTAGHASASVLPLDFVREPVGVSSHTTDLTVIGHPNMVAHYEYLRSKLHAQANPDGSCTSPSLGIPSWTSSFTDKATKKVYCYQMVGSNPTVKGNGTTTTLTTQVYAYKLTFSNGQVFDPTAINTKCDSVSPLQRLLDSPLFNASPISNGKVSLGNLQYEDAQSVGEWYKFVKKQKDYAVNLADSGKPVVISLTVPSSEGTTQQISGFCNGSIGTVDINWLSNQLDNNNAWSANTIPVVLLWDVFQTESGSCCVLGYHGSFTDSTNQNGAFSVTAMSNSGIFSASGITDIHATSHEFGELINDPFGSNATPLWGHTGQVQGCQNNLEVGDPLTGTVFGAPGGGSGITLNGFTYHPQELVYFNWFTETAKPYGKYAADDVYSMSGTFTAPAKVC